MMSTYTSELCLTVVGGMSSALLNFCAPFLVLKLVNFIEEGNVGSELTWESVQPGVLLSIGLVLT